MKQNQIGLVIRDDKRIEVSLAENGTVKHKLVDVKTLTNCIAGSIEKDCVKSGLLPPGTVSISTDGQHGTRYIVMEHPYAGADITYMKTLYENLPIPRLLFGFTISDSGRIEGVNIGVPAPGSLELTTVMYKYPFSNVNTFRLCTGANSLPKIQCLTQLKNLSDYILRLPDNDDYFSEGDNKPKLGHRALLEHLRDKEQAYYYSDILVPMRNATLKDFL